MSEILGDKLNIVYEDTLLEITPELMKKTIINQNKEIERLKKELEIEQDISDGMLETIDKAIEYIEKHTKEGMIKDKRYFYSPEQAQDILEILKKEENNESSNINREIN